MTQYNFPGQVRYYQGKVRDVYFLENSKLILIASDRISAFDVILPRPIPFKGQILNQIAAFMLKLTADVCPNWLEAVPAANVSAGKSCTPIRVEMVVRGNLSGHSWRIYREGQRILCGVKLPDNLKENDFLPEPIITPSTKAEEGHDEDISREEILGRGIVSEDDYSQMESYALALFERGRKYATERGLVLADTKYEFGKYNDQIYLMDEVHTPDSSRYFYLDGFGENQKKGIAQKQLSKEFVREWLVANNFMGQKGQQVPEMTDERVEAIKNRYIELYENLIGKKFQREIISETERTERILEWLKK